MADFRTSDGIRLHYRAEGREDGPPLLFSNPLGADLSVWSTQAENAAGLGFRVIRYDPRGHGGSEVPPDEATLERLGRDVLELLNALNVERTAYCGLSMGAMTGVWLAMHHPRRFTRFALSGVAVWMGPRETWDARIASVREGGMAAIGESLIERWLTPAFRDAHPDEVERVRRMLLAADPQGYAACAAAIRDMDLRDRLGLVEAPTLIVIGSRDPSTPPDRGQYVVERIPGAQKAVLDAAHLSNVEQPEEFNRLVLGFLAGDRR